MGGGVLRFLVCTTTGGSLPCGSCFFGTVSHRCSLQNPFDESGYYIDKAMSQKDPPIHRIHEDAHRIYAQRLETVHVAETTELHAEDRGDVPHDPPILLTEDIPVLGLATSK